MTSNPPFSVPPSSRSHNRRMRNYLLDPHFQLKYTGYLVAVALTLSIALGALLWRTSNAALEQSRMAVTQGLETVRRGQELVRESQKVTAVVKMTIGEAYSDQPELAAVFNSNAERDAARLVTEQHRLERDAERLVQQARGLEHHQHSIMLTLVITLTALVVLIGLVGIVLTHKVAGPLHKMKRQIRELGEGHLRPPGSLRRGDELIGFFATFDSTVRTLRERQTAEIQTLDTIMDTLRASPERVDDALRSLGALRAQMQRELE